MIVVRVCISPFVAFSLAFRCFAFLSLPLGACDTWLLDERRDFPLARSLALDVVLCHPSPSSPSLCCCCGLVTKTVPHSLISSTLSGILYTTHCHVHTAES